MPSHLDVSSWTKEEAMLRLNKSEMTYLAARGWQMLCGTPDNRYYLAPEDVPTKQDIATKNNKWKEARLLTHNEALEIQKARDL